MDWAEDLKFSIRKTTAKMGRRAANSSNDAQTSNQSTNNQEGVSSPELNLDLSLETSEKLARNGPPRRISGGWAESASKARSLSKSTSEDERFISKTNSLEKTTSDDDIPVIPDLDDIQDELLMSEIIEPPSVTVNRVVTLKELNSDLLNQKAFSSLEDVDLSVLTKCLQSQSLLEDEDIVWEWEKLFTEITAEIHSQKPLSAEKKDSNTKNSVTNDDVNGGHIQFLS
ncbi:intraflagellar transport protein 43 homolog [Condylostylus longicornis]|uniref:intraflagellar transport protein 43 homolog n=1 Tax=Condylostylus longicornis TaxID=2530218 RepID=UPI00244E4D97|nr:intraflagellar transport protein 43 homolog [Condylostylus longicornis]